MILLFANRLGSIIAAVSISTGAVAAEYDYGAYGARSQTGALEQPYGFTGREHDAESGLIYFRARTYDPAAGLFLTRDPLGFGGGDINLYAYVWNDPLNWTDPSGLAAADYVVVTAGVLGLTAACFAVGPCKDSPQSAMQSGYDWGASNGGGSNGGSGGLTTPVGGGIPGIAYGLGVMLGKAFAPLGELWDNWVASSSNGSGGSGGAGGNNGSTGGLSGTGSPPPDWEPGNGGDRYSKDNGNSLKDRLDQSDYNEAERYLDTNLRDGKGWTKAELNSKNPGQGVRYYDGRGNSVQLNRGYGGNFTGDPVKSQPYYKISGGAHGIIRGSLR